MMPVLVDCVGCGLLENRRGDRYRRAIAAAGKPEAQAEGIRVGSPETAPHSLGSRLLMLRCVPPNVLLPRKCRL
jgi:hypothetical protein